MILAKIAREARADARWENVLVGVEGVNDEGQQLVDVGAECERLGLFGHGAYVYVYVELFDK